MNISRQLHGIIFWAEHSPTGTFSFATLSYKLSAMGYNRCILPGNKKLTPHFRLIQLIDACQPRTSLMRQIE